MKYFLFFLLFFLLFFISSVSANWRNEKIKSAQYVTRHLQGTDGPFDHHAILVKTTTGATYLLHSTPESGIAATQAPMSSHWKVKRNIPVKGEKTIGNTLKAAGGISNGVTNYITGGTCILAAKRMEKYLKL